MTQDKNNYKNRQSNELQRSIDHRIEIKRNRQDKEKLKKCFYHLNKGKNLNI